MIHQHVIRRGLDLDDIGDGAQRGTRRQDRPDPLRCFGIDEIAAITRHGGVHRLAFQHKAAQAVIVTRPQIGGEGLLMRGLCAGACGEVGTSVLGAEVVVLLIKHGQSLFLLLKSVVNVGPKASQIAHESRNGGLQFRGR